MPSCGYLFSDATSRNTTNPPDDDEEEEDDDNIDDVLAAIHRPAISNLGSITWDQGLVQSRAKLCEAYSCLVSQLRYRVNKALNLQRKKQKSCFAVGEYFTKFCPLTSLRPTEEPN